MNPPGRRIPVFLLSPLVVMLALQLAVGCRIIDLKLDVKEAELAPKGFNSATNSSVPVPF